MDLNQTDAAQTENDGGRGGALPRKTRSLPAISWRVGQSPMLQPVSLLLATVLALGSDVILWPHPTARPPLEWLPLVAGYPALATVLLDLAARFRVRDVFGLLLLGGLYGMSASLLLYPAVALADMPLTAITRVLGAQSLAGTAALALFFALLRGASRWPVWIGAAMGGLAWGIFGHWFPLTVGLSDTETALALLLFYGAILLAVIGWLRLTVSRQATNVTALGLLLGRRDGLIAALILLALLALRVGQGLIDGFSLTVIPPLMVFAALMLWFQRRRRGASLVERALPPAPVRPALLVPALLFLAAGIAGYALPRGTGDDDPLLVLGTLLTIYGAAWVPTVSLVYGGRALLRALRTQPL